MPNTAYSELRASDDYATSSNQGFGSFEKPSKPKCRLAEANNSETLEDLVEIFIGSGYVPQGGISVAYMPPLGQEKGGFFRYAQAMMLRSGK